MLTFTLNFLFALASWYVFSLLCISIGQVLLKHLNIQKE